MSLKVYYHNCQDLFVFLEKYKTGDVKTFSETDWQLLSSSIKNNKPLQKVIELSIGIKKYNPDVIMFVEVGGKQSLDAFNKHFLDDQYTVIFKPTNSDRGIDYGILVKNNIANNCKLTSYAKTKTHTKGKFSRDLQCLELRDGYRLFLIHVKSKLNMKGDDFEGRSQRQIEVLKMSEILAQFPNSPTFVCGDFNGVYDDTKGEPEFAPLIKLGFVNPLKDKPLNVTYYYFDKFQHCHATQLDYCLAQNKHIGLIQSIKVAELYDTLGNPYKAPKTFHDKRNLPSDHFPLIIELKYPR